MILFSMFSMLVVLAGIANVCVAYNAQTGTPFRFWLHFGLGAFCLFIGLGNLWTAYGA